MRTYTVFIRKTTPEGVLGQLTHVSVHSLPELINIYEDLLRRKVLINYYIYL